MGAHWGVENNRWGQLGTLSTKRQWSLCLLEKANMHIPLCGSQTVLSMLFQGMATCVVKLLIAVDLESTINQTKLTWM